MSPLIGDDKNRWLNRSVHFWDHVIRGPTGEKQLKELPTTVPGLKGTVLLDGVGHYVQQERPQVVTAALLDFLKAQNLT